MPPRRRTTRKSAGYRRRSGGKGNKAVLYLILIFCAIVVAGVAFYLHRDREQQNKYQDVAAKSRELYKNNPDAEVFTGDANTESPEKKKP